MAASTEAGLSGAKRSQLETFIHFESCNLYLADLCRLDP